MNLKNRIKNSVSLLVILLFSNNIYSNNVTLNKILADPADDYEKMKCEKKLKSFDSSLINLPINELIVEVGNTFMGTPYVAGTLDENAHSEEVVVKISGLDCVTFVENTLIFSRLIKKNKTDFKDYKRELEFIRYRDGQNTGYASRLHYFTDWIYDNEEKGVVKDITLEIGGVPYDKNIDFMTAHQNSYKQLTNDGENLDQMDAVESFINLREVYYIPKENISGVYDKLKDGDIIGITSTIKGLDVAHTGYVFMQDGVAYLMNASLKDKQVEISPMNLQDYLMGNPKQGGIIVARVLDVK
ncbi:MAG: DUF1460 domain-containing protein [Bacteroidota bacterium]|nr:DUF1460 domain-containing protein [Bacteroidota bacterium]